MPIMPLKSKYANLLNQLSDMQESPAYAARKQVLAEAERLIVELEQDAERWRKLRDGSGESSIYPGAQIMLYAHYEDKPGHEVADYDNTVDAFVI